MAYVISEDCISCGACEPECPTKAIFQGDDTFEIIKEKCTSCGMCASVCPVDAPHEEVEP